MYSESHSESASEPIPIPPREILVGARGGSYYVSDSGKRVYLRTGEPKAPRAPKELKAKKPGKGTSSFHKHKDYVQGIPEEQLESGHWADPAE